MKQVLKGILQAVKTGEKLLAVLIDPEKFDATTAEEFLQKIPFSTTHIFIGGSTASAEDLQLCTAEIKAKTVLPVVLFPGDYRQISSAADALLFLSLLSGRNPDYLIEQQVRAVPQLRDCSLEIIPTAYLLIDGGKESAVERASKTAPLPQDDINRIVDTALAGKFLGKQLIYLEAGSGAENPVNPEIIFEVKKAVNLPVIVGGGIASPQQMEKAYSAGADMVVVGTAFEKQNFFSHGSS